MEDVRQNVLQDRHGMELTVYAQMDLLNMEHVKNVQLAAYLTHPELHVFAQILIKYSKLHHSHVQHAQPTHNLVQI